MGNPLDIIDLICSGGYQSKKLDAYMQMRALVARQIGDKSAPIMQPTQLREQLLLAFKREVARSYRTADARLLAFACLFYGRSIGQHNTTTEMAELVTSHPGTDFGIMDLDKLGQLIAAVINKNLPIIGNMLVYEPMMGARGTPIVDLIRECGGTVTEDMIKRTL